MKWSIYSICILCIIALSGVAFCADQMGNKTTNAVPSANQSETFIFVQEGSSGSFVNDSSGNYTLTMNDVVPYTMYFADRPARDVGLAPMDKFLKGFGFEANNPANAAIVLPDENETSDMVVVMLSKPQYDNKTGTITYKARLLKEYLFESGWLQDQKSKVDASIPEKFGRVVLVIDDCPCWVNGPICSCQDTCWNTKKFRCSWCGSGFGSCCPSKFFGCKES